MQLMKKRILKNIIRFSILQFGAVTAAFSLEEFLVPNKLIDGGIVGISMILSYLGTFPLGLLITLLNIPFIFLALRKLGKEFVFSTVYSILSLSFWVTVFKPLPQVTSDVFLASIFGGILLGLGVGLVIKHGASFDGTEIIALLMNERIGFSIGEIVMFFNFFILGTAGFVFGWDKAMYSLITYLVAYKVIDMVIDGIDDAKAIYIISAESKQIRQEIIVQFGRGVTVLNGKGGFSEEKREILYFIVKRSELYKLKNLINEIAGNAFITISNIHEIYGKNVAHWKKKK